MRKLLSRLSLSQIFFSAVDEKVFASGVSGFHVVQALAGDIQGQMVDFFVASNTGQSSSILKPGSHLKKHPDVKFDHTRKLEMRMLDDIVDGVGVDPSDFDLLFLDVQGAEYRVLQGAPRTIQHSKYIWTEVNYGGLYEDDISFSQMIQVLDGYGFNLNFCRMNRHGWGDALFVRREGRQ